MLLLYRSERAPCHAAVVSCRVTSLPERGGMADQVRSGQVGSASTQRDPLGIPRQGREPRRGGMSLAYLSSEQGHFRHACMCAVDPGLWGRILRDYSTPGHVPSRVDSAKDVIISLAWSAARLRCCACSNSSMEECLCACLADDTCVPCTRGRGRSHSLMEDVTYC